MAEDGESPKPVNTTRRNFITGGLAAIATGLGIMSLPKKTPESRQVLGIPVETDRHLEATTKERVEELTRPYPAEYVAPILRTALNILKDPEQMRPLVTAYQDNSRYKKLVPTLLDLKLLTALSISPIKLEPEAEKTAVDYGVARGLNRDDIAKDPGLRLANYYSSTLTELSRQYPLDYGLLVAAYKLGIGHIQKIAEQYKQDMPGQPINLQSISKEKYWKPVFGESWLAKAQEADNLFKDVAAKAAAIPEPREFKS